MTGRTGSTISYFLLGLGVGSMVGILFAPKSGEETREYLAEKAKEGREYTRRKKQELRELRERAETMVERGKEVVTQTKELIATAIDAGREAYHRELSKARNA